MALFNYYCDEVKRIIEEVSPNYPQLTTYTSEWLYFYENDYKPGTPVELEYETVSVNPTGSVSNAIPFQYKSAILKGNTKYRDIDTGNILDTFDETKNLELVSVKVPVLTTSNEDGTKSNILTVNEDVVLCGIGDVKDELNLITGELTQRVGTLYLANEYEGIDFDLSKGSTVFINLGVQFDEINDYPPILSNTFETKNLFNLDEEGILYDGWGLYARVLKSRITELTNDSIVQYLNAIQSMVFYRKKVESVKTVDLTPLNKPYEGTNHYTLTSNIPCEAILEVPVVSTGKQTLQEINN